MVWTDLSMQTEIYIEPPVWRKYSINYVSQVIRKWTLAKIH